MLEDVLGSLVYRARSCTAACDARELPSSLTRAEVLDAGAQVVIVDNAGKEHPEWRNRVFGWNAMHDEERPHGYADCQNAGADPPLDYRRMIRFYEDSTWLTAQAEVAGQSSKDDGLKPDTVREMVRCGVDLFGFDQLVPGDDRLEALAWSLADGEIDRKTLPVLVVAPRVASRASEAAARGRVAGLVAVAESGACRAWLSSGGSPWRAPARDAAVRQGRRRRVVAVSVPAQRRA